MRPILASLLVATSPLVAGVAAAEHDPTPSGDRPTATATPVIGGTDAPAGKWPEVAALYYPDMTQGCTGVLIAPTVALTAAHCLYDGGPSTILVGTASLARRGDGEFIPVTKRVEYSNSQRSYDIAVLVLEAASRFPPRAIASGWARFDLVNSADAAIVGYGAIDRDSNQFVNELQEAMIKLTDADCTTSQGCNTLAKPAGELGAGGNGVDTCQGDSGGPLFLVADHGTYLAGITSRGYDNNQFSCSEGGIYTRPDKVVDWIEEQAGVKVARGPEPTFEPIVAVRGHAGETLIEANDPRSTSHTYAITTPPMYATAKVRDDGMLRVCTDPGVAGADKVVVTVTDTSTPSRALAVTIPITITDGTPGDSCDVDDFGDGGGGCCDSGRSSGGALPLALGVVLVLRRRRRETILAR